MKDFLVVADILTACSESSSQFRLESEKLMSDAQVIEMSITTTKNRLSQDFTNPNDRRSSGFCSCNPSWLVIFIDKY